MLIVSSIKPTDKLFHNLSLEERALLSYLDDCRQKVRQGHPENPVCSLIERGRATEQLMRIVVKNRSRGLFDERNSEALNMRYLQILEQVFLTEDEVAHFLDLPPEHYC